MWGSWRVPFVFGLLIGPVAYYIRRHIDETAEFQVTAISPAPLRRHTLPCQQRKTSDFVWRRRSIQRYDVHGAFYADLRGAPTGPLCFQRVYRRSAHRCRSGVAGANRRVVIGSIRPFADGVRFQQGAILVLIYPMFVWLTASPSLQTLVIVQIITVGILLSGKIYTGGLPALMSRYSSNAATHHESVGKFTHSLRPYSWRLRALYQRGIDPGYRASEMRQVFMSWSLP